MAAITFFEDEWHDGSPRVMGPLTQSFMHGSTVFDGARAFSRQAPDLDLHCARLLRSAEVMGLETDLTVQTVCDLAIEGVKRFDDKAELYIRPALWAEDGFLSPEGEARFSLTLFEAPMPEPSGLSVCLSNFRRPDPNMAPTLAKAACLYPNTSLALKEAKDNGFDNAVMRDGAGNVVELGTSNLWLVKDGIAITPEPNGTFLDGVTRRRVLALLSDAGIETRETTVSVADLESADELFSTGNLGKVLPITRFDTTDLQPGPVFTQARTAYFAYAQGEGV
jgi:branched-chain amino acid aminotransferase